MLPDDPSLYFAHVFLQLIESDPGAIGRLSFTQGVDLRCGFDL